MSTTLTAQITTVLTKLLGRAPTTTEILLGQTDSIVLNQVATMFDQVQTIVTVPLTGSIQTAINNLSADGGGVVNLVAGTYSPGAIVTVPSNIKIQGVGSNATIIDFGGSAYQIKAVGTSGTHLNSIFINGVTVQNSSTDLMNVQYVDTIEMTDIQLYSGSSGMSVNHVTLLLLTDILVGSCSSGISISNATNVALNSFAIETISAGVGLTLDTVDVLTGASITIDGTSGDGCAFTSCTNMGFNSFSVISAGGNGITATSCTSMTLNSPFIDTITGDGVHLVSSSSVTPATGQFSNCGGYGINITNSACDNCIVVGNQFISNTAGNVHDLGTGTLIRSNIGPGDNGIVATANLGSGSATSSTFLRGDQTWAAPPGKAITILTAAATSLSISPNGSQVVAVWAKGNVNNSSGCSLLYNSVTKDSVSSSTSANIPFALQYTEMPASGTHNITLSGTNGNEVIIAVLIG